MRKLTWLERLKCLWLSFWCPRFWDGLRQAQQQNKPGPWDACVILQFPFKAVEKEVVTVQGDLVSSYIEARRLALKWDRRTNYPPGGHYDPPGVGFGIRKAAIVDFKAREKAN